MPAQTGKSNVLAKIGNRLKEAFVEHKNDDTEFGQIELPAGIRAGIAQVERVWFDEYKTGDNVGEPYFMAQAVVLDPKEVTDADGRVHRVAGQHTRIGPEPLCDTPKRQSRKTFGEHVAWVLNELRKMGVDTATLPENVNLEAICKTLTADKSNPLLIHFDTFRMPATPQDPNPRTNHRWLGPADPNSLGEVEVGGGVDDGSGDGQLPTPKLAPPTRAAGPATANGKAPPKPTGPVQHARQPQQANGTAKATATTATTATAARPQVARKPAAPPPPEPEPQNDNYVANEEIEALGAAAMAGDENAVRELCERAEAMGYSTEQINDATTWAALAEQMMAGGLPSESGDETPTSDEGAGDGDEPGELEWEPNVGLICNFRPTDPKTKKPAAKLVEVEVTEVDADNKTVTLKNMANPKVGYKNIAWDRLEVAAE